MFHGSRNRLTEQLLPRFAGTSLFDKVARAVCRAGCLPRKELYEAWEVARRVRRHLRGGRVVDAAAGHGLLATLMLLIDDSSPAAICVDVRRPPSFAKLQATLGEAWPRLVGRVTYQELPIEDFAPAPDDLIVSSHACGALTDRVLDRALEVGCAVAVLPCCHPPEGDAAGLGGWLDKSLAIDVARAGRLRAAGYRVRTLRIPEEVTPKNRLLVGEPG